MTRMMPAGVTGTFGYRSACIFGSALREVGGHVVGPRGATGLVLPHASKVSQEISNVHEVPQCLAPTTDLLQCEKYDRCFPYDVQI